MLIHGMATIEKSQKTHFGEDMEKLVPLCTIAGSVKWYSAMENSMAVCRKLKNKISIYPRKFTSGHTDCGVPKIYLHTHFIAASFTIATMTKHPGVH